MSDEYTITTDDMPIVNSCGLLPDRFALLPSGFVNYDHRVKVTRTKRLTILRDSCVVECRPGYDAIECGVVDPYRWDATCTRTKRTPMPPPQTECLGCLKVPCECVDRSIWRDLGMIGVIAVACCALVGSLMAFRQMAVR